jgi:L-asparaginase II
LTSHILATASRSGLVEEYHPGAVAVVGSDGRTIASFGDIHRPFFIRSSAKPFQAQAALEAGAELPVTHVAVASSSHSGDPVHVAIVDDILARHGLDASALKCPPARPFLPADRRLAAAGDVAPSPRYHNCSGKHAALLAACVVAGWDIESYLDPAHPLQARIATLVREATGEDPGPPGVDGCGLPVWRVTATGLARAFAALGRDERFVAVRTAMARYPMLVSGEGRGDGLIARWTGGVAKVGASGCMGAAIAGYGIGVKAWSGSPVVAAMGVTLAMETLGMTGSGVRAGLEEVWRPPVRGGGKMVGRYETVAVLEKE